MLTIYEAPWAEYLEIDEETGNIDLKVDTPQDIREKYESYCLEQEKYKTEFRPK
jgi:hypothetical protein